MQVKYCVSKCRFNVPCRYHGRAVNSPALVRKLQKHDICLVCPEEYLGIPRPPIRVKETEYFCGETNITASLVVQCESIKKQISKNQISIFIGVKNSPCCDPANGILAQILKKSGVQTRLTI